MKDANPAHLVFRVISPVPFPLPCLSEPTLLCQVHWTSLTRPLKLCTSHTEGSQLVKESEHNQGGLIPLGTIVRALQENPFVEV